jgi:cell division protein FtsL
VAVAPARVATPAPVRPRTAPRAASQRRVAGGVVWIVLAAVLLAGLVALNVAVLQLNVQLDELSRERTVLQGERAALEAQLASAAAAPRIQARARNELGLVPADQSATRYLDLAGPR